MQVKNDTEIQHIVTDAATNEVVPFIVGCDHHGMTIELPGGHIVTLDLSGGVVSIYHTENSDETGENIRQITLPKVGPTGPGEWFYMLEEGKPKRVRLKRCPRCGSLVNGQCDCG
jgi:hypothetical protein